MKKSSSDFGATSSGESVVAFTAAEGTHVEMVVLMEGEALGGGVGSSDVGVGHPGRMPTPSIGVRGLT